MRTRRLGRARVWMLAVVPVAGFALAGCATTIDNGKAEQLVRQSVSEAGNFKVQSVSCPSDVTAKAGGTFECKLGVTPSSGGATHNGTVTIHMTDSKGHVTVNSSDFHVPQ